MKTKNMLKTAGLTLALSGAALTPRTEAAQVELNGQPLATSARPVIVNGRTLVPMRDIFQALGAKVDYNAVTRGISATRGATKVDLQIGNREAMVDGNRTQLEQSPLFYRGSTMVPLRFVSTALGAKVNWNAPMQLVSIETDRNGNGNGSGTQVAGVRSINVPRNAIVPVTLDSRISSATARVGDTFTATVRSQALGDSEFPAGSKIEGVISEVRPMTKENPGVLDLDFRNVILPDGSRYPLAAQLTALDDESVSSTSNGRIMAKTQAASKNDRLKVIGIGAGAGYLLGKVLLKKDGVLSAVLGAAGGFLYDQKKSKNQMREAMLPAGAELGVKLNQRVTYADTTGYSRERVNYINE